MDLKDKKIYRVLQLLSNKERKQFLTFLTSAYFVKPEHQAPLQRLLKLLQNHTAQSLFNTSDEVDRYAHFYPEDTFIAGRIEKLYTQFLQLIYHFLGLQKINQTNQISIATAEVLRDREATSLWKGHFNKAKNKIERRKVSAKGQQLDLLRMNLEAFHFQNLNPSKISQRSYFEIINALDRFYIKYILDISLQLLAHNKFTFPIELQHRFEALKVLLQQQNLLPLSENDIALQKLFHLLQDNSSITIVQIKDLIQYLNTNQTKLHHEIFNSSRSIIRNFTNHLYNIGHKDLEGFILQLYQEDIASGAIFHQGKIQSNIVLNISTSAIRQRQFDWLEQFLLQYKSSILEIDLQEFIIKLIQARIRFFKGEFEAAKTTLDFNINDYYFKAIARTLEVMILYELAYEQLSYKIEAYKLFIYRIPKSKISNRFTTGHGNFIDVLKSIYHPKTKYSVKRMEKLKQRILDSEIIAEKYWLLEKIDQILMRNEK